MGIKRAFSAIKVVKQKPNSEDCGQCCVAMLAGITKLESYRLFRHCWVSTISEIKVALDLLGIKYAPRALPIAGTKISDTAIILGTFSDIESSPHFILWCGGYFYCPHYGKRKTIIGFKALYFLEIDDERCRIRAQKKSGKRHSNKVPTHSF